MNEYKITVYRKNKVAHGYASLDDWEFGWIKIIEAESAKSALELARESLKDTKIVSYEIRDIVKL